MRALAFVLVFVLGFIICALSIFWIYGPPTSLGPQSSTVAPGGGMGLARRGSNQISVAAQKVSAYVVNIDTIGRPQMAPNDMGSPFPGMPPFLRGPFGQPQEVVPRGSASGVIFTPDGNILTNNHVVANAQTLTVTTHDGRKYKARLLGRDPKTDLAVIKIDARNLSYTKFANSDLLQVGDWVIAVGNSLGLGPTVTVGIVSATKRGPINIEGKTLEQVIQTDAAINRGNSGGALADINGDLVGVNSAIASSGPDGGSIGIGFAVPSNTAKTVAEEIMKTGTVVRPWLGVRYGPYDEETRKNLQPRNEAPFPNQNGVLIAEVVQGSPAALAGLKPYDVILKIGNKPIAPSGKAEDGKVALGEEIGKKKVGDRITLEVWHAANGSTSVVGVTLGKMPADLE